MSQTHPLYTLPYSGELLVVLPPELSLKNFSAKQRARFLQALYQVYPTLGELTQTVTFAVDGKRVELPTYSVSCVWKADGYPLNRYFPDRPYQIGYRIQSHLYAGMKMAVPPDPKKAGVKLGKWETGYSFMWSPRGLPESDDDMFADLDHIPAYVIVTKKDARKSLIAKVQHEPGHRLVFEKVEAPEEKTVRDY